MTIKKTGFFPVLGLCLAFAGTAGGLSGCSAPPKLSDQGDCMEPRNNRILWGLLEFASKDFNPTCSDARFSANLIATFNEARTEDKALVALYAMMKRYFQDSPEKRAQFDKALVSAGIDAARVEKVSRMYAPAQSGFDDKNCTQRIQEEPSGATVMRLQCLKDPEPPAPPETEDKKDGPVEAPAAVSPSTTAPAPTVS